MPTTSPASSSAKYLLYHHFKALDQVQELGLVPVRLFRVLYPLWRVRVEGRQRVAAEFDELEWFLERGLQEAGFHSAQELAAFFGLELVFVQKLLAQAREIGHLAGNDGALALTALGQAAVFERVRYTERILNTELYFEALGNLPLTLEHYKIPILETLPDKTPFQAFYHFDQAWNTDALEQLLKGPDKAQLNLPDEISAAQLVSRAPVYLPVYFVEAREDKPSGALSLLIFSQVRGLRDKVLEYAVNRDPKVYRALKARTNSRAEAVQRYFEQSGLKKDAWYLNENGPWGAQVMVDGEVFLAGGDAEEESGRLTLRNVGRYALIYDWCVWVMCDDVNIRTQAAAEQLVEWLQNVNIRPAQFEVRQKITSLAQRLNVPPPTVRSLLTLARRKGFTRAAERLEELDDD
jgi:hypothetical protein